MHKRVANKVRPIDTPRQEIPREFRREDQKKITQERQLIRASLYLLSIRLYDYLFERQYASFPRGTRLTLKRIQAQKFRSILSSNEKRVFLKMIFNRETTIAFIFLELGRINEDVCPLYQIRTILHKAQQIKSFSIAKLAKEEYINMLYERLD